MRFQYSSSLLRRFFATALFFWLIQVGVNAQAATSVWKVEKDGNQLFLGGTLHLLSAKDFPLPPEFAQAYQQAGILYFETNIDAINSTAFMARSLSAMSYSDGRTLRSVLKPDTYTRLSNYLAAKGMPIFMLNGFTAGGVSLTITMLEFQSLGYTNIGVDRYFFDKARADGKKRGYFETPDEQLAFIAGLGDGIENEIVLYTLAEISRLGELVDSMKAQWRQGDVGALYTSTIADLKTQFPEAYASLFLNRNNAWMPEIEAMLQTDEIEFVLVGAAHMAGPDGLLQQLASKGYKVSQL